ncbi:MAG TPA: NAD(P)/FAD-dependent oxidoreductase [Phycisphaerales bacterium]|nr:NAD(P)/FAD-dependent oxidoreductase [Phycisphaerales bacterium]HIB49980.1 NAD(P)/FAD-dependent oxidoreductase [Phycisphaerales bacterium]HIN84680.1 NAD(P)/FAD-dependent oxidoreductase [Phycisphaerales bacterium]HIO20539.1 NAD(P)/FAD-dependent oxidoreductase [Phycisphaerales bacterium]HIO53129.1 NAD(P)/FAD-dependent oxidoreductase [Phycisphaerales bacterium]
MVVGQFSQDVDVLVIGGGPAGYTAAFRAAELGKTVAIVDPNETLGGDCLHHACIPSKTSLLSVDSSSAIASLGKGLEQRCKTLDIERLFGVAHFENKKTAQVTGEVVSVVKFRKAIIATGSQQRVNEAYPNAMQVEELYSTQYKDKTILIVGNTPSAIEAATFASNNNTVSLWLNGEFLPSFERQLVKFIQRKLSKCVSICSEQPDTSAYDCIVLADYRLPQTKSLQLENANVHCVDGFIVTDDSCKTSNPKIYAVGECSGCHHNAALAITQGRVAGEASCGLDAHVDSTFIPKVAWSSPEIAQVGEFDPENTVSIQWGNSGLAVALKQQSGVTLLSFERESQAILGIGIVGTGATEMISEGVLALEMGATLYDLATTVRPHPTRSELLSDAARIALSSFDN